jgi:small multidrug resistance pump
MNKYVSLCIAIVSEIIATSALKASAQFTKLWPSVLVVLGYAAAFYFLSVTLKKMDLGIAYALWSGIGIVLVTIADVLIYKQKPDMPAIIGMAFIIAGVLIINLFSKNVSG